MMDIFLSPLAPIFLFSNWRTSGTALAFTFRKHDAFYVFTEPLNPTLKNSNEALEVTTSSWKSKHPDGEYYFTEYAPILSEIRLKFPEIEKIPYVLEAGDIQKDLKDYFAFLISYAHSLNKIPVFKLEQAEGSAAWIKTNFPDSLLVGVTRNADYQFISWLEQATFGNSSLFFGAAHNIIEKNLDFFDATSFSENGPYDIEAYENIFNLFKRKIDYQHSLFMNFCIDISPETEESLNVQLDKVIAQDFGRLELWRYVLSKVHDSLVKELDKDVTIKRLKNHLKSLAECSAVQDNLINSLNDFQRVVSDQISQINTQNDQIKEYELLVREQANQIDFLSKNVKNRLLCVLSPFYKSKKNK